MQTIGNFLAAAAVLTGDKSGAFRKFLDALNIPEKNTRKKDANETIDEMKKLGFPIEDK